jgi:hypothetical protein
MGVVSAKAALRIKLLDMLKSNSFSLSPPLKKKKETTPAVFTTQKEIK